MKKCLRSIAAALAVLSALALPISVALTMVACSGDDEAVTVTSVNISHDTMALTVGGPSGDFAAALVPANASNRNVTWTSSATGVATVQASGLNATVTPVSAGAATITVRTADGGHEATCAVTVTGGGDTAVAGVSVIPGALSLVAGGATGSLAATLNPPSATNQNVTWTSSATGVATVLGDGLNAAVTPVSAGTATITVKTADGGHEATCAVIVTATSVPVTGVTLDRQAIAPLVLGYPATLTAAIVPGNATNQNVAWSSDDTAVATVSGSGLTATVTAVDLGSATITVTTQDGGKTATCAVTVGAPRVTMARTTISAANGHSLAIKADGGLWAWGYNWYGQLGLGDSGVARKIPTRVGADTNWATVTACYFVSLGLKADGGLWAWGQNDKGQLGLGDTTNRSAPARVGAGNDWAAVTGGNGYTLALKADGGLWAWGSNNYGQLGLGDTMDRNVPAMVGADTDWAAVTGGDSYTLALKADGSLWAWGRNNYGQLGLGDGETDKSVPTRVGADGDWVSVSAGHHHSLALKADGTLWAWGNNGSGRLGLGDTANRNAPAKVGADGDWAAAAAGSEHSFAIKGGGLWAWGDNYSGQLGLGDSGPGTGRNAPARVGADSDWTAASAGRTSATGAGEHSLAIKADGGLWAWGLNYSGELGLGDETSRSTPTPVGDGYLVP